MDFRSPSPEARTVQETVRLQSETQANHSERERERESGTQEGRAAFLELGGTSWRAVTNWRARPILSLGTLPDSEGTSLIT